MKTTLVHQHLLSLENFRFVRQDQLSNLKVNLLFSMLDILNSAIFLAFSMLDIFNGAITFTFYRLS